MTIMNAYPINMNVSIPVKVVSLIFLCCLLIVYNTAKNLEKNPNPS